MNFWILVLSALLEDAGGVLVQRMRDGDPKALDDLYRLYGHRMYALTLRIVNHPGVAEDLVQEAFLRVWTRARQLNESYSSVGPWLITVARNCALDYRKGSRTIRESVEFSDHLATVTFESDVESSELAGFVSRALKDLPKEQREVLELAYYDEMSQTEIAERLQLPLGTVKSRSRLALQRLKGVLADVHRGSREP